ncbi:hypothetical protein HNY73_002380 [Argiope bruennichi]|uniref:Peptidase A2 domain-containing protein n=1 Tax=Argiope bruennichi TaxID=94029 RepID=A0A8T0FZT0_ARGBR|nr:hypothetical protein HNY73_002380 [Argiope bruennichi]
MNRVTRRLVEATCETGGSQKFPKNATENRMDEDTILTTQLKAPEKEITRISPLQKILVKVGENTLEGIVDAGAEITVIRHDIIDERSIESYLEDLQENLGKAHSIAMENAERGRQNIQEDITCELVRTPFK